MFNQLFNPPGAEYNVPFSSIRPGQNEVNISGYGQEDPNEAFGAFSRLFTPFVQGQNQLLLDSWTNAANDSGSQGGEPFWQSRISESGGFDPRRTGPEDISNAVRNMFQQRQDKKTVGRYFGRGY